MLDKTRLFGTGTHAEPTSPPESASIAEYSIKHDYSAQERSKNHPAPLRERGVQNAR